MAETRNSVSPVNPCVISDKPSENIIVLSDESNESTVSSSVDASSDAVITSATVTEEMFEIERQLEEESKAEEQKLREEAEKVTKERKEHCYKRLQHLLNRSTIYSQFLVSRMEKQQETAAKKKEKESERQNRQKLREEKPVINLKQDTRSVQSVDQVAAATPSSKVEKRPLTSPISRSHKRVKQEEIQLSEIFDKEDLNAQANKSDKPGVSEGPAAVSDTYSRTINGEKVSDLQPNLFTGGVMRSYQIEALEWLKVLYENGVNGILGDEMGLGKTIECIALIAHLVEMGVAGPYLVICPLSTLYNWCNEFQRFTPEIPVILYHGTKEERAVLRRKLRRKVVVRNNLIYPVLVTSYTMVMNDRVHLMNFPWIIVIDEGHRIKNWQCRLVRELKRYQSTNRLLLTGTPLQNNLAELWSLLNFLLPEIFDDLQVFESWFDVTAMSEQSGDEQIVAQEQEKQIISTIHQILTPFLLRRTKADVDLKLPPKKELIVYAPITQKQRELYSAVADKTIRSLLGVGGETEVVGKRRTEKFDFTKYFRECNADEGFDHTEENKNEEIMPNGCNGDAMPSNHSDGSGNHGGPSVIRLTKNNGYVMMRKICNHPYLVEFPLDPMTQDYLINEDMVKVCGKLQVLDLMLRELRKRGHKVLIFSQFVTMLDILDYFCEMRGYPFNRIHGDVKVQDRQRLIDDFNENPSSFIFLISTRAGGLGINLTRADTVIIYDSDWNPQNDLQAQDRCHRYGQTRPVVVYRLVTANTVDQRIVERACAKRKLEKMIIRNGRFSSCAQMKMTKIITPEELLQILRETDFSGSMNMEDVISPEDLNMLLDRSDMLRPAEKNGSSNEGEELKHPAEVKGVFKVVEQIDSCNFGRNIDVS